MLVAEKSKNFEQFTILTTKGFSQFGKLRESVCLTKLFRYFEQHNEKIQLLREKYNHSLPKLNESLNKLPIRESTIAGKSNKRMADTKQNVSESIGVTRSFIMIKGIHASAQYNQIHDKTILKIIKARDRF